MKISKKKPQIFLAILAITLVNLACMTMKVALVYDQDGSGSGTIYLEMIVPDKLELDADDLAEKGWENIRSSPHPPQQTLYLAEYHFDDTEELPIESLMVEGKLTVEGTENEYKYFTFDGTTDFSPLEEFWNETQNDYAINGIEGVEVFGGKTYTFTAEEIQRMIDNHGPPYYEFSVILPGQTPVDANQFWDNEDEYLAGDHDGTMISWTPGDRIKANLMVKRRLEPFTCSTEAESWNNISELLLLYQDAIPKGATPVLGSFGGHINNTLVAFFNSGNYICSDYQGRVLRWLDIIRTSPDENLRNLLKGLDYGPIQTNGGGHRAVVLFPSCTDWKQTGIILDPWPYQNPIAFRIKEWGDAMTLVWGADNPLPDSDSGHLYPHLRGEDPSYPASAVLLGDLSKGLAKPTRILLIRSPINMLMTMADGRQIGLSSMNTLVNDLPGEINLYAMPKAESEGEIEWWVFLPDGAFSVDLTGIGNGDYQVFLADQDKIMGYGTQSIQSGEQATFSYDPASSGLSTLNQSDGTTVYPDAVSPNQLAVSSDAVFNADPIEINGESPLPENFEEIPETISEGASESETISEDALESETIDRGLDEILNRIRPYMSQILLIGGVACLGIIGVVFLLMLYVIIPRMRKRE